MNETKPVDQVIWQGVTHQVRWKTSSSWRIHVDNWFSNIKPCNEPILWRDDSFPTIEHAYQSAKFIDPAKISIIQGTEIPERVKVMVRQWPIETPHWERLKLHVMWGLCLQKWMQGPHRKELLCHLEPIIEFVNWRDSFWAVIIKPNGQVLGGLNCLGQIMTSLRDQLLKNPDGIPQKPGEIDTLASLSL